MSSTFGGIVQAGTGLTAASYGLQVVSQNIDNAATPGYTRQSSQQQAVDGVAGVPTLYVSPTGLGGVVVANTARLNDPVADARSRTEAGRSGVTDTNAAVMSQIEDVFPEPSNTGLTEQLNDFWNAWSPVSIDPGSEAPRSVLLGAAATVASTLNSMSASLDDVEASTAQTLTNTVRDVNSAAKQLNTLNKQIALGTATHQDVNALLDQRDLILDKLATTADAKVTFHSDQTVDVSIGGEPLVTWVKGTGGGANQIVAGTASSIPPYSLTMSAGIAGNPPYDPAVAATVPAPTVATFTPTGGTISAFEAALTSTTTGIPAYKAQLDTVANALATAVNAAQTAGFDLTGTRGTALFSGVTASTIGVVAGFATSQIAAAAPLATTLPTDPSQAASLNGDNALGSATLGTAAGSADKTYQALVGDIGQNTRLALQAQSTQFSVTAAVNKQRTAASGVSTDEEISNLLTYQRAYQASSRVITTMDDMLDTLINRMAV